MIEKYADRTDLASLTTAVEENVLVQLDHLRTHPSVAVALARGEVNLYGWVYRIETGEVFAYDSTVSRFVPLLQSAGTLTGTAPTAESLYTNDFIDDSIKM